MVRRLVDSAAMARKRISKSDIIGEQGIALIHRVVSGIGFLWHPTGGVEAGTDGFIEVRDPVTGEVSNCIVQVQSRATSTQFTAETPRSFHYLCEARDLDCWLAGNAPVILVRSRPSTNEAYWVSVKDYFKDINKRKERRIVFDKEKDRFDDGCRDALIRLAVPRDSGLYLSPLPRTERLYSNLLKVTAIPGRLFIAETRFRRPREVWDEFRTRQVMAPGEWMLKSKEIVSVHDLRGPPWDAVCDSTSTKEFDSREWSSSDVPVVERDFVWLLNRCLTAKADKLGLQFSRDGHYYFFRAEKPNENEPDRP